MHVPVKVADALAAEFAIPSASVLAVAIFRLLLAAIRGGVFGYEREKKERSAGLKTHMLVSVGSALFVLAPLYAGGRRPTTLGWCRAWCPASASLGPGDPQAAKGCEGRRPDHCSEHLADVGDRRGGRPRQWARRPDCDRAGTGRDRCHSTFDDRREAETSVDECVAGGSRR